MTNGDRNDILTETENYRYEKHANGTVYLRQKLMRNGKPSKSWGKRLVRASPTEKAPTRLTGPIRKLIVEKKVSPPPNWVYNDQTGRIAKDTNDTITNRKLNLDVAKQYGFNTKKSMVEFLSNQYMLGNTITTFSSLKKTLKKNPVGHRITRQFAFNLRRFINTRRDTLEQEKLIKIVKRKEVKNLRIKTHIYELNLSGSLKMRVPNIKYLFQTIIDRAIREENLNRNDRVQIRLESQSLHQGSLYTFYKPLYEVNSVIESAVQKTERVPFRKQKGRSNLTKVSKTSKSKST